MSRDDNDNLLIKASHQLNPHCPVCDQRYDIQRIRILDETENGVLSYFTCQKCSASFLATIIKTPFGHMASGLLTDLEADEVLRVAQNDPVTYDDVIEVHEMLENNTFKMV